jgi:hypothetical protein
LETGSFSNGLSHSPLILVFAFLRAFAFLKSPVLLSKCNGAPLKKLSPFVSADEGVEGSAMSLQDY